MRPLDFYRLGIELARDANTEARQRTVVNRLYYGLHHEACCRLFREHPTSQPLNRNRRHADLHDRFSRSIDPRAREIAQLLRTLARLRAESDYQLEPLLRYGNNLYNPLQIMEFALGFAGQLLEALDDYSKGESNEGCRCPEAYVSG